jgi:hypothetical protein
MVEQPLTDAELEAIAARTAAVPDGPWAYQRRSVDQAGGSHPYHICDVATAANDYTGETARGEFIAHAREDIPRLLAEVRRLRAQVPSTAS